MRTLARTAVMLVLAGVLLVGAVLPASAAPTGSAPGNVSAMTAVATAGEVGLQSPAMATSSAAAVAGTGGRGLRLRSGAGLRYTIQLVMPEGAAVAVLGQARHADGYSWYPVAYGGRIGWAAGAYLAFGGVAAPASGGGSGSITDIIVAAANRYGQSPEAMLAVARCESNLNPRAVNPISIGAAGNNASGLFQFLPSTWRTTPYASHDIFDPWASANAAGWMWSVGRRGEWVC